MTNLHTDAIEFLIGKDYLKYVPEFDREKVKLELLATADHGIVESDWGEHGISHDRRIYPADHEELAEGKIGNYLMLMKDSLAQEGVSLESIVDDFHHDHYDLVVNGERFKVYARPIKDSWAISVKRFLEIVNELLHRVKSNERLFCIYGGNDGRVILLTKEMHQYLAALEWIDKRWMPRDAEAIPV